MGGGYAAFADADKARREAETRQGAAGSLADFLSGKVEVAR
jgi:hypothetical protein